MNNAYEFKKGDQVPAWVLRGPNEQRQKDAVFGCDVTVYYFGSCAVRVEGRVPIGGCMVYIANDNKGYQVWEGAPTEWIDLNKSPYLHGSHYESDSVQLLHLPKGESHE